MIAMKSNAAAYNPPGPVVRSAIPKRALPIPCPCCGQSVHAPTLQMLIDRYRLTPLQGAILAAVWSGKGMPVSTERIMLRMYEDDPQGGPSLKRQYASLREGMSRIRIKLQGSGVEIQNAGLREGWRLVLTGRP